MNSSAGPGLVIADRNVGTSDRPAWRGVNITLAERLSRIAAAVRRATAYVIPAGLTAY